MLFALDADQQAVADGGVERRGQQDAALQVVDVVVDRRPQVHHAGDALSWGEAVEEAPPVRRVDEGSGVGEETELVGDGDADAEPGAVIGTSPDPYA